MKNYNNKMILNNLNIIIKELSKLPETKIDIDSISEPICGTPGCFAGLISLIINEIPDMKKIYDRYKIHEDYNYKDFANILAKYLGFFNMYKLNKWKVNNPKIWGKGHAFRMFYNPNAWEQEENEFSSKIIINKLKSVHKNLCEIKNLEKKNTICE